MSNEETKNEMKNQDKKSELIGVDPLAWLSEEEKTAITEQHKEMEVSAADQGSDSVESSENSYTIKLNNSLTIREISSLMEELNHIDDDKSEYIFDPAEVERVDAAAMQLLTGFYLFAIDAGKKVIWHKPSEAFCNAVKLLGLGEVLHLSPLIS